MTLPAIRCNVRNATVGAALQSFRQEGVRHVELLLRDTKGSDLRVAQGAHDPSRSPVALLGRQEDAGEVEHQHSNVGPFAGRQPLLAVASAEV